MKLIPYLFFPGTAQEAIDFYTSALNGTVLFVQRFADAPVPTDEDTKNKIMHATLAFGDYQMMLSDDVKGKVSMDGNVHLSVDVPEEGAIDALFNKMAEGGQVTMPHDDTFWGARFGMLKDKFGVSWMFNHDYKKEE